MTPKQWKRLFARIALLSILFVGAILIALLSIATWHLYTKERTAREEHLDEVQSLSELQNRRTAIESQLKQLDTERGIEEEVRTRYPLVKPGEEEIMLVASKPSSTSTPDKKGFWDRLFGWLPW